MGEIDTCQRCLPYLKDCMRGAGWEDSHWLQVRGGCMRGAGWEDSHWLQVRGLTHNEGSGWEATSHAALTLPPLWLRPCLAFSGWSFAPLPPPP